MCNHFMYLKKQLPLLAIKTLANSHLKCHPKVNKVYLNEIWIEYNIWPSHMTMSEIFDSQKFYKVKNLTRSSYAILNSNKSKLKANLLKDNYIT